MQLLLRYLAMVTYDLDDSVLEKLKGALDKAKKSDTYVEVGLFEPDLAQIGYYNEYGTAAAPPRPFVKASVELNQGKYEAMMAKTVSKIIKGGSGLDLESLGNEASEDMSHYATNLKEPANAPSTIKRKGFDNPLIDTGAMVDSIAYKVAKK